MSPLVVPTVPGAPQAVSAKWVTTSSVQVSFEAPVSDGGSVVTSYFVQCTSTTGGVTRTASGASSPLTLTKLTVGATYQCQVRAINAFGDGVWSEFVPVSAPTVPGAPQAVSAKWVTTSSVQVSFEAPSSDGGSEITGYVVECTSTTGGVTRTASGASSALTLTKLTVGATYQCQVRAINAVGEGPYSEPVPAVAPTAPGVPQAVSAKWVTTSRVQVSFAPPVSDGGSAVTSYVVECRSTDGGVTRTTSGASSPLTLTKLTVGKTYECRVRAINAFGDGPYSEFVLAVSLA